MKKKLIVGNWKANPESLREAKEIFLPIKKALNKLGAGRGEGGGKIEVVICPPAVFLSDLAKLLPKAGSSRGPGLSLGAQDSFWEKEGAYTGALGPTMLRNSGATWVILGHSERRRLGDGDGEINRKLRLALDWGLNVILCVGEERRDERGDYLQTIKTQVEVGLRGVDRQSFGQVALAYEPVWAIGAQARAADTPAGFLEQAIFIRKVLGGPAGKERALTIPILYGGSVKADNAAAFLGEGTADGLLVGRASLDATEFTKIIQVAI